MFSEIKFPLIATLILLLSGSSSIHAGWPANGVGICTTDSFQLSAEITRDGSGGAIIAWEDRRSQGSTEIPDIYAQRIDSDGNLKWTVNGVRVHPAQCDQGQYDLQLVYDGGGGAIITWWDARGGTNTSFDIYAQRVDKDGNVMWTSTGVPICTGLSFQIFPKITSDGAGGAIITWVDYRTSNGSVQAQRVNADGTVLWNTDGVVITYASDGPGGIDILLDGAGGAWIVWSDDSGVATNIYIQRVYPNGDKYWIYDNPGRVICTADDHQYLPRLASDDNGGVIVTWEDHRNSNRDVYAQRINGSGTVQWTANGVAICTATLDQHSPEIAPDGDGGAVITWKDWRNMNDDIYAQRINSSGTVQWTSNGIPICTASGNQVYPKIAADTLGGAIITWQDPRSGTTSHDIYAQRLNANGDTLWPANGKVVCNASGDQGHPRITQGAIITWVDSRDDYGDIYANKVNGTPPMLPPGCEISWDFVGSGTGQSTGYDTLVVCPEGDFHALKVSLDFDENDLPSGHVIDSTEITLDKPVGENIKFWNKGVIIADGSAEGSGYETTITHSAMGGCSICSGCGAYNIKVRWKGFEVAEIGTLRVSGYDRNNDGEVTLSDYAFFIDTYNKGVGMEGYDACMDFNCDGCVSLSDFAFFGEHYGHTRSSDSYLIMLAGSDPESDLRVRFIARRSEELTQQGKIPVTIRLENATDVSALGIGLDKDLPGLEYTGWSPNPDFTGTSMVTSSTKHDDGLLLVFAYCVEPIGDGSIEMGTLEYEIKGGGELNFNEKDFALAFGEVLGLDGRIKKINDYRFEEDNENPPVFMNRLAGNYPNPFNPATTIEFSVASGTHVNLSIYNVNGQLVRTLVNELKVKNNYKVAWNGKDDNGNPVSSGVYFYRITADNFTKSKKLVILR